ncbi:nitrate ABC transporter permease [Paenibacillus sp. 32O-W]|uniref:ABC transporter permease n=1 Tax=Paenibacillus sp. 32O-W TaxID=1695218 RepID=UPI00072005DF|nr:ABC transporter permease [Paenibacillus sp. 32O-W]ALS27498.1 nitrate ABC transporter permease [Paenibacillus sp. 32O-W]
MGNKGTLRVIWPPAALSLLGLAAWQLVSDLGLIEPWLLPSPLAIAREALAIAPRLLEHAAATAQLTLIGFAAGTAAGLALAALLHLLPGVKAALYPLLVLSQNIPIIVIGPLFLIWFGFTLLPKVLLVALVCFFPVCVAMLTGLAQSDPHLAEYMRMIGANKREMLWKLELPNAMPYLFSGLKIAATYSVMSGVIAEWIGAEKGLGYFMLLSSKGFQPARVFAAVALVVAMSLALFAAAAAAERLFVRWRPAGGDEGGRPK